jgi:adenine-specific DNA methylase
MARFNSNQLESKALGAFYTPESIADALAAWVVRDGRERLLEPSVGEGALVMAAIDRARSICGKESLISFLVCDINPNAVEAVTPRLPPGSEARAVDFLQLDPLRTGHFQGVIANPPFTRNHAMAAPRRTALRERFKIVGAAGLWVHFLFHAKEFLAPGGRLAAVFPASGLFTSYGRDALRRLAAEFAHVEVRQILEKPRWINGADERGALFLAEGYREGTSVLPAVTSWSVHSENAPTFTNTTETFDRLAKATVPLESLATLSIGAVTGCNAFFLLNEEDRRAMEIPLSDVRPVVSRARHVPGLHIDAAEVLTQAHAGQKTWLLAPQHIETRGTGARRQLAKISKSRRRETLWFHKRSPWWRVQIGEPCHAIFTYMNDHGPKLVLTSGDLHCTNTLHRIRFKDGVSISQRMAAALTMVSTFGQLAAERLGRSYGGGVLKFEINEARRMPALMCGPLTQQDLRDSYWLVDRALRDGDRELARVIADKLLLTPLLGVHSDKLIAEMNAELKARRSRRQGRSL